MGDSLISMDLWIYVQVEDIMLMVIQGDAKIRFGAPWAMRRRGEGGEYN